MNKDALLKKQNKYLCVEIYLIFKALESQLAAEEAVRKAESEQRAAVEELKKQEESYQNSINTLETKSKDPNASTVSKFERGKLTFLYPIEIKLLLNLPN